MTVDVLTVSHPAAPATSLASKRIRCVSLPLEDLPDLAIMVAGSDEPLWADWQVVQTVSSAVRDIPEDPKSGGITNWNLRAFFLEGHSKPVTAKTVMVFLEEVYRKVYRVQAKDLPQDGSEPGAWPTSLQGAMAVVQFAEAAGSDANFVQTLAKKVEEVPNLTLTVEVNCVTVSLPLRWQIKYDYDTFGPGAKDVPAKDTAARPATAVSSQIDMCGNKRDFAAACCKEAEQQLYLAGKHGAHGVIRLILGLVRRHTTMLPVKDGKPTGKDVGCILSPRVLRHVPQQMIMNALLEF